MIELFSKISEIPGIGKFYSSQLARYNVHHLADFLWLFPKNVLKAKPIDTFTDQDIDKDILLNITITSTRFFPKVNFIETITTSGQKLTLVFFKTFGFFKKGMNLCVSGRLVYENNQYQIKVPRWRSGHQVELTELDYKVDKVPNSIINKAALDAISFLSNQELLDQELLIKQNIKQLKPALEAIHTGNQTENDFDSIAFAELMAYRLGLLHAKHKMNQNIKEFDLKPVEVLDCLQIAGFSLTEDQNKAWKEILWDLISPNRMLRMLYGDVGSGKTILAILSALLTYRNGKQAAILAPTQILANQHYELCKRLCPDAKIVLLTSATKSKAIYNTIATEACIIVGTHALIEPKIKYYSLALLVIDEHHRFGVLQRLALSNMGLNYHLLIMSATPIPRTLKLLIMDNIAISKLSQRPQNHRDISVRTVYNKYIDIVYDRVSEYLQTGGNVFWICPFIEKSETKNGMDVITRAQILEEMHKGNVIILHGRMKNKDEVLTQFKENKGKILVSTTVIEVGVNIPEANLMIIENSEHFGLSQLYQLLGRVGRGEKRGECYLVYEHASGSTKHRLEVLKTKQSGMEVAKADMMIRGYGNILGTEQNGRLSDIFKVFDPDKHLGVYDKVVECMNSLNMTFNFEEYSVPNLFRWINSPWSGG